MIMTIKMAWRNMWRNWRRSLIAIVAIVLGTTFAFWGIGIDSAIKAKDSDGRPPRVWPRYVFFAFVIISFLLAANFAIPHKNDDPNQKTAPSVQSK